MIFKLEVPSYQDVWHFTFICYLLFKGKKVLSLNKIVMILVLATGILRQFVFLVIQGDNYTHCFANGAVTIRSSSCIFYCHVRSISEQTFCKLIHLHRYTLFQKRFSDRAE